MVGKNLLSRNGCLSRMAAL